MLIPHHLNPLSLHGKRYAPYLGYWLPLQVQKHPLSQAFSGNLSETIPSYRQLRAKKALLQLKDVTLITRRALLLYEINGNGALLNGTSLNCNSALLALNWRYYPLSRENMNTHAVPLCRYAFEWGGGGDGRVGGYITYQYIIII